MPINIPAFVASQLPVVPLKGNWNRRPKNPDQSPQEDMFCSFELDWSFPLGSAGAPNAVSFNMASNSPVGMGQIAALVVDNSRCGSDVAFYFPDTGFELVVDARAQGVFVVLTNALAFLVIGRTPGTTDITIFQVCNTVPPPVAQFAGTAQQVFAGATIAFANGSTTLIAPTAVPNGTLQGFSFVLASTAAGSILLQLQDGTGKLLWSGTVTMGINSTVIVNSPSGLNIRFTNGIVFVQSGISGITGTVTPNVYISIP